jgi:hypothetical protein
MNRRRVHVPISRFLLASLLAASALLGCTTKSAVHGTPDGGSQADTGVPDSGHSQVDGGGGCRVACGACEQPITIQVFDDTHHTTTDQWTAHITGNGADCTAHSSFDSCISDLHAGTYQVEVKVGAVQVYNHAFTVPPTMPPEGACCDCGYKPAHLDVHYRSGCDSDGGAADGGGEDGGAC